MPLEHSAVLHAEVSVQKGTSGCKREQERHLNQEINAEPEPNLHEEFSSTKIPMKGVLTTLCFYALLRLRLPFLVNTSTVNSAARRVGMFSCRQADELQTSRSLRM